MRRAAAGLAAVAALAAPAAAAAKPEVDAGALRAEVAAGPWHLELTDDRGRPVLSESRSNDPSAPGALGFRTAAGWTHATRVVDSSRSKRSFLATLATTDPARSPGTAPAAIGSRPRWRRFAIGSGPAR